MYNLLPFYRGFETWEAVMAYAQSGRVLYYKAPLNAQPTKNFTLRVQKRTLRIIPPKQHADPFTADKGHLDRFYYPIA